MGDLSNLYLEGFDDPINYIFQKKEENTQDNHFQSLSLYRSFFYEGENLNNFCRLRPESNYATVNEKEQVLRTVFTNLQLIGIDILGRAIPAYAKKMGVTEEQFSNISENIVGNFCSKNITIFSKKTIKQFLEKQFSTKSSFELPSIQGNPLFSDQVKTSTSEMDILKKEWIQSIKLFKAICSWGGDVKQVRLLAPLLRNSSIMAFVFRQMTNRELFFDTVANEGRMRNNESTLQVACDGQICRRTNKDNFIQKFPRAVGSPEISQDLDRLYCTTLKDIYPNVQYEGDQIKKWVKQMTMDDEILLGNQFVALITKYPDFIVRADKFSSVKNLIRSSMDKIWDEWSEDRIKHFSRDLYYEEPLKLELVDNKFYYNPNYKDLKINLDVNLGEYDRSTVINGKVSVMFPLKLKHSFLRWIKREKQNLDPRKKKKIDHFNTVVIRHIEDQVRKLKEKFAIPPWEGDLTSLLAEEITNQVELNKTREFLTAKKKDVTIPIYINYGIYALKYLNYEYKVKRKQTFGRFKSFDFTDE